MRKWREREGTRERKREKANEKEKKREEIGCKKGDRNSKT